MKSPFNIQQKNINGLLKPILTISAIFLSLGFILDYLFIIMTGDESSLWDNLLPAIALIASYILYRKRVISPMTTFVIHILVLTLKMFYYIILKIIDPAQTPESWVYIAACVLVMPIMYSCLTQWKLFSRLILATTIILLITVAVISKSNELTQGMPTLIFVLVGAYLTFSAMLNLSRKAEQQKAEEIEKQNSMARFLNISPKELNLIMGDKMTKEQAEKILEKAEKAINYTLMDKLKETMRSEESIKSAIRSHHPHLTALDLQLCFYIIENRPVSEISRLRKVSDSSITAQRSRLRTKLGLDSKENLRDYLNRLIAQKSLEEH